MDIEKDFFSRKRPAFAKLKDAGFRMDNETALYEEAFAEGQFLARLTISPEGSIRGEVIDLDTGEEYLPIRARDVTGGFVGRVREEYLEVLGRISDACFVSLDFMMDQSNRIAAAIEAEYGVIPEFPWEKYPGNGTFKCPENGKWFAALLTVAYGKLDAKAAAAGDEAGAEQIVEVMNLKADPEEIPKLTGQPGIWPAWHMNKKHWISVLLDDTMSDEEIMTLVRNSRDMVAGRKKAGSVSGSAWIIPSNPKLYDVDAGFARTGEIEWHQHNDIKPGDTLFIYSAAPNSAILYRCEVTASDLSYHGMFRESKGYRRSMRIKLIEKYPKELFPLSFMKAHGGSAVRSARRMPEELLEAMETVLNNGGKL